MQINFSPKIGGMKLQSVNFFAQIAIRWNIPIQNYWKKWVSTLSAAQQTDTIHIMTNEETIELLTGACRAYDRLSIVMDQLMEYWLEGHANPPKELIDAYYDAKDDVGEHINVGRIHEMITPHNGEFYEKIESPFGLDRRPNL